MGDIADFYVGTTKSFSVTCKINGEAQDITGDTVTVRLKENKGVTDAEAAIEKDADVATQGADGVALFALTPSDTDIDPGRYHIDVEWVLAGGAEYIVYSDKINALERSSDV